MPLQSLENTTSSKRTVDEESEGYEESAADAWKGLWSRMCWRLLTMRTMTVIFHKSQQTQEWKKFES